MFLYFGREGNVSCDGVPKGRIIIAEVDLVLLILIIVGGAKEGFF